MKLSPLGVLAALALAAAPMAFADTPNVLAPQHEVIKSVDATNASFTTQDGVSYTADIPAMLAGLKPGTKVLIFGYEGDMGPVATTIDVQS